MTPSTQHYDIAIIGAGVAGLSLAYFLGDAPSIVLLEAETQPAYHSSGRSAAMYIESYENETVSSLTSAGKEFFSTPPDGFCEHPLLKKLGGLTVAGKDEAPLLERFLSTWQPAAPKLQSLDAQACLELIPNLRKDWVHAGAYDPSWQAIDVHELLSGYRRGFRQHGGELKTSFAVQQLTRQDQRWLVESATESVSADIVINAAGAWSGVVGALAGNSKVPLTPLRRTAVIVPAPESAADWPIMLMAGESLYFKYESPGLMVCPCDETPSAPTDAQPDELDVAIALDRLQQVADIPTDKVLHKWAGLRTFVPDRRPVVGFDPTLENFFWLAGQGGFGVQTSPGLGQIAAQSVFGKKPPDAINVTRYCD